MATIKATDLATLLATNIDSTYNVVVFDSSGDTYQVEFESATHQANDNNGCICVKEASLTIPSADVLTLNSAPIEIVPAQGVGTAIEVLSASMNMVYNSVAYATNTNITIAASGATEYQYEFGSIPLASTSDVFATTQGNDDTIDNIIENDSIVVSTDTGNPTAGDSDITIYVTYRVITL